MENLSLSYLSVRAPRESVPVSSNSICSQESVAHVVLKAKNYDYNNQINKSPDKIKTTWNIIEKETNRYKRLTDSTVYHNSPEAFNNYFLTISENIIKNSRSNKQNHDTYNNPSYYLLNQPFRDFPNI